MKRINTVFTAINILAVITMLIQIGYEYSRPRLSTPPEVAFYLALLYIPLFAIINGIWLLIRKVRIGKRIHDSEQNVSNDRKQICLNRLTIIFTFFNILLSVAIIIHSIIVTLREGCSLLMNWIGIMLYYGLPAVLINDAWVVISVNMKDRLD